MDSFDKHSILIAVLITVIGITLMVALTMHGIEQQQNAELLELLDCAPGSGCAS